MPGKLGSGSLGYGYLIWLLPGARRQFSLRGLYGQHVLVDPPSKLVMVQTAVERSAGVDKLWAEAVKQFG
jgi:CubicO group peptidase (beta-lactamase class C family)